MRRRYDLRIAERARQDIHNAKTWLTQPGSGPRGQLRYANLNRALLDLREAPLRWPLGDYDVRERPIEGYRFFYVVDEDARRVTVIRLYGPFQDRADL
jgi:hypothetical protein